MNDDFSPLENELMEEEDALFEEMKVEFRQRLQERLQKKIQTRESAMPEVQRLKKNGGSAGHCDPPSER
ncbi:MAG: hypothetical protein JJU29_02545 [Verrucomicrobia bacterium]|nr:hypothetical protein [Verrucomicrobiota bacterium]MCH8511216.1 hypothetical protein [Kiritimatiellia bacterium]